LPIFTQFIFERKCGADLTLFFNGCRTVFSTGAELFCFQIIDMDAAIEFREHCKEVSKDELDMIIKAELFAHTRSGSVTEAKKHKIKERECPY
jgi:hypothetical protein